MRTISEASGEENQSGSDHKITFEQAKASASKIENAKLLDTAISRLGLKNDAALSRAMEIAPPLFSKVRNGKVSVGAVLAIRLEEVASIPIKETTNILAGRV